MPPSRGEHLKAVFDDRKEKMYHPMHGAAFALAPSHIDEKVWSDEKVMSSFHTIIHRMALAHPEGEEAGTKAIREFYASLRRSRVRLRESTASR